jgi:Flp pilus assembly protein TadD
MIPADDDPDSWKIRIDSAGGGGAMSADPNTAPAPPPGFATRWFGWGLAALLLIALLLRLAILAEFLRENPIAEAPWSDGEIYWNMAGHMAAGQWTEPTPFLSAPLYPYLLGVIRTLGGGLLAVYLSQIGLHLLSAFLLAVGTRARFGPAAALLAVAGFLALTEPAVSTTRVMPNTLQVFLVILLWWRWSAAAERATLRWRDVLLVGGLLGLLALAYPAALLLIPVYGLWIWAMAGWKWHAPCKAVVGCVAALLAVAPATLHNYLLHREFILISAHGGITLRQGNGPESTGIGGIIPGISPRRDRMHLDAAREFRRIYGRDGSWSEIDRHYQREATAYWRHNPGTALRLFGLKIYLYLTARNYDDLMPTVIERELGIGERAILAPLAVPWLFGAACVGWIAFLRRPLRRGPELLLWLLPLLTVTLFFYSPRYRLPAVPLLCVTAAYGLTRCWSFRVPKPITLACFCLPLPFYFFNQHYGVDSPAMVREYYTRAISEAQALAADRRARDGRPDEARVFYQKALALWPENPLAHRQLGVFHAQQGRPAEAESELRLAIRLQPNDPQARAYLYNLYCGQRRYAEAAAALRELRRIRPRDFQTNLNLAWLLATCPEPAIRNGGEAVQLLQALQSNTPQPRYELLDALAAAHAEIGDFEPAARRAEEALRLAETQGRAGEAAEIKDRLKEYRENRPYRGAPRLMQTGRSNAPPTP